MANQFLIGYINVNEDTEYTDRGYECAAWYQKVMVKAGKYPVFSSGYRYHERERRYTDQIADRSISISLPGVITSDDFGARYFGNAIGGYDNKQNAGKESSYYMNPYAHAVASNILEGTSDIELIPEFEAREINFEYDGEPMKTYGIFKKGVV